LNIVSCHVALVYDERPSDHDFSCHKYPHRSELNHLNTMPRPKKTTLFEDSLNELEQLVEQMEQGDISLEESLKSFERGVKLTNICQKALTNAEQKVHILLEKNGQPTLEPFNDE